MRRFLLFTALAAAPAFAHAQDTRTVTEPTFPTVCSQVAADLSISAGEPSSELNTAHDTSLIQTALTNAKANCAQGTAVELIASGSNNAFVIAPIFIPAGITLLVDGGVTVFGSRNATDYQINGNSSTCGSTDGGAACNPLITVGQSVINGSTNTYYTATLATTGIMGYGIINGRGQDKLITLNSQTNPTSFTTGSSSWWDTAVNGNEDAPILIAVSKVANVTFYKISFLNSPHFHVKINGQGNVAGGSKYYTNFTAWGLKLITPWTPHNTDGIDPTGIVNMTVTNSILGDGDDEMAISGSSIDQNITWSNLLLPSGHGLSIGSITTAGVSNVAVSNVNFPGQSADGNQVALRIKSYCGVGGVVSNVNYNGVCIRNTTAAISVDPFYSSTSSTTSCPTFGTASAPITFNNIYLNTANAKINYQGQAANISNLTLSNMFNNSSTLNLKIAQSNDTAATPSNDAITLNGSYYPAQWNALASTGNNVTETVNGTVAASFPTAYCANAFPVLNGELFASTAAANNINQATTITLPATLTLNAMLQPVNSTTTYSSYTGAAAPTASVQFLDGTAVVGTGTLGANGTLASVILTNPTAGTHTYTANYIGDTTYAATPFGTTTYTGTQNGAVPAPTPLVITVNAGPAAQLAFSPAPPSPIVYGTSPGTLSVAVQDAYGNTSTSTASVTLTVTGPNAYSQTYTATATNGIATFTPSNPPSIGSFTYTATSPSLTTAQAAESVTAATLTVTPANATRAVGQPNPAFTYTISGYVNNDPNSVVTGTPTLSTTANNGSGAGTYPITAAQGTLAAANYVFAFAQGTLTVTGNPPQLIIFYPLPNLKSGATYQLTARTTSGNPVTYTVSGPATITGSTLSITGTGQVTVTANAAATTADSAAPTATQTFTAQ